MKLTGTFTCIFDRHAKTSATDARRYVGWGATFSKIPAHYPDPGNPGHYMNVFKTPTTLNDGQQQPVNNFAPRASLKCFFKDGAISSGASEVKEQQVGIFVEEKHMLEYIRHLEELQIVSMIRENSGLYSFDSEFWREGGALKILKTWRGGIENLPITSTGAL